MTNMILMLLCAVFVIIGSFALVLRNETVSTRHRRTQFYFVFVAIGGLLGMEGNYFLGITLSLFALTAYIIRWRRFQQDKMEFTRKGIRMPEYKKP